MKRLIIAALAFIASILGLTFAAYFAAWLTDFENGEAL